MSTASTVINPDYTIATKSVCHNCGRRRLIIEDRLIGTKIVPLCAKCSTSDLPTTRLCMKCDQPIVLNKNGHICYKCKLKNLKLTKGSI